MHRYYFAVGIMLSLAACQTPGTPLATDSSVAEAQADLATDPAQAALWKEASEGDTATGISSLPVPDDPVAAPAVVTVADRAAAKARTPFPATMESGFVVIEAPDQVDRYSGTVRVTAIEGEFLTLDLGGKGTLVLQAKVRGGPLRATAGEKGKIVFRRGDPFARNDLVSLKLPDDALLYAVDGGREPVRMTAKSFGFTARQLTGSDAKGEAAAPQPNTAALRLTLDGETHLLRPGDQARFSAAKMTIELWASLAIEGESANAIEGDPYRVELFGWRTQP